MVNLTIVAGNQADVKAFYQLPFALPAGSALYADSAYTNYLVESMLADDRIKLYHERKANAYRKDLLAFSKSAHKKSNRG